MPMSNLGFRLMHLVFMVRDCLYPRAKVLQEAGIHPGSRVLDFGCGPGSYIGPLLELVGPEGRVYALDAHPLAIATVEKRFGGRQSVPLSTIGSNCQTGLADDCLDAILLYDVFHHLPHHEEVLRELHRVLKPAGILSVSDHHLPEQTILEGITGIGLFQLKNKGRKTLSFSKKL